MRICSSVCGEVLLDACAYEQESASTDALWTYVMISVEEDTGQQVIELQILVAISDVLRCATGHSDMGFPVEDKPNRFQCCWIHSWKRRSWQPGPIRQILSLGDFTSRGRKIKFRCRKRCVEPGLIY